MIETIRYPPRRPALRNFVRVRMMKATNPLKKVGNDGRLFWRTLFLAVVSFAGMVVFPGLAGASTTDPSTGLVYDVTNSQATISGCVSPCTTTTALTIPATPTTVVVPNVVGQPTSAVGGLLTSAQLTIGTQTSQCDNSQPLNNVISSNPPAGAQVAPQTAVNIVISSGSCNTNIVPAVVGQTYAVAQNTLSGAGLTSGTGNCTSSMTVASQNPTSGTRVTPGTLVTLTCSTTTTTTP